MAKLTTAQELRKLTEAAKEEQARLRQEEIESFVENILLKAEEKAKQGQAWLPNVELPCTFMYKDAVKKHLEGLGYTVENAVAINCINIYW